MAVPKKGPLLNELHSKIYWSDGMVSDYGLDPDEILLEDGQFSQGNVEPRVITDYDIPKLNKQLGLYAGFNIRKGDDIIETLAAKYYRYTEWEFYGKKRDENDVIRFDHEEKDIVAEPWKYASWRWANDCKDSQSGKQANAYFEIRDNNEYKIPLISLVAMRDIKQNHQIFVAYGKEY